MPRKNISVGLAKNSVSGEKHFDSVSRLLDNCNRHSRIKILNVAKILKVFCQPDNCNRLTRMKILNAEF
jgi:hypothetical protein